MLAPNGKTKLATGSGMPKSVSAAASITGREASDEVVENPINAGARTARKNRASGDPVIPRSGIG